MSNSEIPELRNFLIKTRETLGPLLFLLEETEVYTAVLTCFFMSGVLAEIGVLAVLDNQPAFFFENVVLQDCIGKGGELLQGVRRIRKNQIIFGSARIQKLEHIPAYHA